MPNQTQVSRWGNSLAIRIPQSLVREAGLTPGDRLSLDVTPEGDILVRSQRRKYTLEELVAGITSKNRHSETDWGAPRGKEAW